MLKKKASKNLTFDSQEFEIENHNKSKDVHQLKLGLQPIEQQTSFDLTKVFQI